MAIAAAMGWRSIVETWNGSTFTRLFLAGSVVSVVALAFGVFGSAYFNRNKSRHAATLSLILVAEAFVLFMLPYLSYPRGGNIDKELIAFLRGHAGYQRVIGTESGGLAPNYGSYYGISLLNFNDLPTPELAVQYIRTKLDPFADSVVYIPQQFGLTAEQQAQRVKLFHKNLTAYGKAGVKFVLSGPNLESIPVLALKSDGNYPYALAAGQNIEITGLNGSLPEGVVDAISVLIGTYGKASTGHLKMTACVGTECAEGIADLSSAEDNQPLTFSLNRSLQFTAGAAKNIKIEKLDGDRNVALWMYPLAAYDENLGIAGSGVAVRPGFAPSLRVSASGASGLKLAYNGRTMNVYELPDVRSYLSAESCTLKPLSRDRIKADCSEPAKLVRLELAMNGWKAFVNGTSTPINRVDDAFQIIDLPQGVSDIEFRYEPSGFRFSLVIACASLLVMLLCSGRATMLRFRKRWSGEAQAPESQRYTSTQSRTDRLCPGSVDASAETADVFFSAPMGSLVEDEEGPPQKSRSSLPMAKSAPFNT